MAADFVNQVFMDLLSEDGLVVLARCGVTLSCHVHGPRQMLHPYILSCHRSLDVALHVLVYQVMCACRAHHCRGLGLDALVLKFLHLYCDPCSLVLVLGTNPEEEVGCWAVLNTSTQRSLYN